MDQPKPKIVWSCEPDIRNSVYRFKATMEWYGTEITAEGFLRETDLCIQSNVPRLIVTKMMWALAHSMKRVQTFR